MKRSVEDKILLQFGDERRHLQTSEIDAERTDKELAISNLVRNGYVTARENESSRYDKYISVSITTEGKARQKELLRQLNRKWWQRTLDGCKAAVKWCKPHTSQIVFTVIAGLILAYLSKKLGLI